MTTESQPLIDCRNVRKIFPDSAGVPFAAVDDVSFRLSAGEIVGLLGPDGAGKTTLIRLITGLMKPHGGSISVLNLDSVKKSRSIQASIGYMPQKFGLYEDLTVRENMELYARMHGVYGQDREKRFRSLLAMTSLERFTTRLAGKLSGGMKQRVVIAMALVAEPELLLADEPTTALDVTIQAQILELMKQLQQKLGMAIIMITHDLGVVADMADDIIVMYAGKIVEKGSSDDIFYHPHHPYTWALMNSVPRLDLDNKKELVTIEGSIPDMIHPPKGCAFCARCDKAMKICLEQVPEERIINESHRASCWINTRDNIGTVEEAE